MSFTDMTKGFAPAEDRAIQGRNPSADLEPANSRRAGAVFELKAVPTPSLLLEQQKSHKSIFIFLHWAAFDKFAGSE